MRYTVVWIPSAEAQLAELWMQAPDRQAVSESANRIERELGDDAPQKGIHWDPFRAFFDDPLAVLFAVDPGDCMVRIMQVRRNS